MTYITGVCIPTDVVYIGNSLRQGFSVRGDADWNTDLNVGLTQSVHEDLKRCRPITYSNCQRRAKDLAKSVDWKGNERQGHSVGVGKCIHYASFPTVLNLSSTATHTSLSDMKHNFGTKNMLLRYTNVMPLAHTVPLWCQIRAQSSNHFILKIS